MYFYPLISCGFVVRSSRSTLCFLFCSFFFFSVLVFVYPLINWRLGVGYTRTAFFGIARTEMSETDVSQWAGAVRTAHAINYILRVHAAGDVIAFWLCPLFDVEIYSLFSFLLLPFCSISLSIHLIHKKSHRTRENDALSIFNCQFYYYYSEVQSQSYAFDNNNS